jgi:hypothetical protein
MRHIFHSGDPDEWKPFVAILLGVVVMFIALGMLVTLLTSSF